ncbi:Meiotically up-regulated gene 113 [Mucilaginibacter pineti]|uniref:Meiotically up-regulated gene 113 n=1 Tax=Mucilaginibacter pineti TaxID=1391627 RepID=A0A1G7GA31_9SPHI|nr:GIY-YIG nuclease family protein [Mucilaginibacter pineti]SDE84971.1 Meiotically up-regulated gene 113 [Mucilaginibacter pineti]
MPDKFDTCCFRLSKDDIVAFDEVDNGPINNVMAGLADHCYGVNLFDDEHGLSVKMFYINGARALKGDLIELELRDRDYFELLMRFCMLLADDYLEVDALDAFNTFQSKLRGFLEKLGFTTISSLEIEKFEGQNAVMMTASKRGFFRLKFMDKKEFYRDFFNNVHSCKIEIERQYIYLMVNTDTSLIKIGKSNNPRYRERTLHSQEPVVHLVALWCCDPKIEKDLHKMFAAKRVRGEWFRLLVSDLTKIERHMNKILT